MAKILTQSEIDALLHDGASAGTSDIGDPLPIEGRTVLPYDFKHPNRISKDQIRSLESLHSSFAGKLASGLSGMLRSVVDVDLLSVDQLTYSEFINSLTSPSCTYTFAMKPLDGECVLDVCPTLTFAFVDRMFGGKGESIQADREMTGIEASVMDKITRRAYRDLAEAWARLVEVEVVPQSVETTPQFVQVVPPGETVIVAALQLKMLEVSGVVKFCYPYVTLESVITGMGGQNWFEATRIHATDEDRDNVRKNLSEVNTSVSAVLARTGITMREFLNVNVGDVIMTDTDTSQSADVFVGGVPKFSARPGMVGRRCAVEITGTASNTGA